MLPKYSFLIVLLLVPLWESSGQTNESELTKKINYFKNKEKCLKKIPTEHDVPNGKNNNSQLQ